jgi:hypothetical protein
MAGSHFRIGFGLGLIGIVIGWRMELFLEVSFMRNIALIAVDGVISESCILNMMNMA